ncbi:GNAT family N-acetyltransferase [Herbaspirillum sp. YR522]|uniref:GNAT family N-acetyltransferase n=1 Tax=Herbaspirillum sp. YR522 TaxID=1144342 RepID=UPI00026F7F54|nr:GNAT family N-acetyltransferase [Herbaspirillum sp. YR522]EJN08108.1 putative acetyltransferase [Herbaspirillum sp. YR522]
MACFWRAMTAADLPQVMQIAARVHIGYFESEAVFAERLALFAPGCMVAVAQGAESTLLGYGIMHPARYGHPPALDSLLHRLDIDADGLHLHDIALLPQARGGGLGRALMERMHDLMRQHHLAHASLVAVHGSAAYWRDAGFVPDASMQVRLASYGKNALYMVLSIRDNNK